MYRSKIKINHQFAFTLIELVVVILIIGIMAVSIGPKFVGVNDFNAIAYRDQMISSLRLMQQKAMQQTSGVFCHQIYTTSSQYGKPDVNACASSPSFSSSWQADNTGFEIPSSDITLTIHNSNVLTFDAMGIARECSTSLCKFSFESNSSASLCVETQGYIHACN